MRSAVFSALFAFAAVQQAAAWSGDWNQCQTLSTPQQADNQCTDDQKQGLDLTSANLPEGTCNSYQNFDLSGLSYGSFSGNKQRSLFSRRGGSSDNCLKGQASKGSGPSMSCGSGIPSQKASIKNMQVSCDKDTDVQFVHSYAGSDRTCSYTKSLKAGSVNNVDNTQCGGSTAVKCQLPDTSKEESCNVGFHSIAFDCTPGQQQSSSAPQSSPSQAASSVASSPPESKPTNPVTVPISSAPGKSITPYFPIPSGSVPFVPSMNATTPSVLGTSSAPSVPIAPLPSQAASSPVPVSSAPSTPAVSPAPSAPATSAPSEVASSSSPPESTVAEVTSEIVYTTITSCPVTNTKTYGSTTSVEVKTSISTVLITSTETICTQCVAPPRKTSSVPASPESQIPQSSLAQSQVGSSSGPALPVSSSPPASGAPVSPASSAQANSVPALPVSSPAPPASSPSEAGTTVPSVPVSSAPAPPQTTREVVTTAIVYTTLTTCPVTNTVTPAHGTPIQQVTTTISTIISTSISTVCTKCVAPIASTPAAPPASSVPVQQATSVAPPASSPPAGVASSPAALASSAPPASSVPSQQAISVVSPVSSTSAGVATPPAVLVSSAPSASSVPTQQATSVVSPASSVPASVASSPAISIFSAPPASSVPNQEATSVVRSASSAPAVVASSTPPTPIAPGVLPSCVKTWITVTKCKDNSDYDCYCQDDTFTTRVFECISSWEQDHAQQQAAFSYYAGICAKHVPSNPAIITAVPSSITLVPQPSATTVSSSSSLNVVGSAPPFSPTVTSAPAVPVATGSTSAPAEHAATPAPSAAPLPQTTISISTTLTLPCSAVSLAKQITNGQVQTSGLICTTTSLLQTAVTLPQVAFTTGASSSVGLQAGPAPVQAAATGAPAAPIPGGAAGSSIGVPKITGTTQPFTGAAVKAGPSGVVAVIVGAVALALFA